MRSDSLAPARIAHEGLGSNAEHVRAELAWMRLVATRALERSAGSDGRLEPVSEFGGLYVSEEEMRSFIEQGRGVAPAAPPTRRTELDDRIVRDRIELDEAVLTARANGVDLRLPRLTERFGLSGVETRLVMWCVAPDLDARFQRCLAFLQNDLGKKRPSLQLLGMFVEELNDVLDACALLGPGAPLIRHRLLSLPRQLQGGPTPLALQQPAPSPQLVDFLTGQDRVDATVSTFAALTPPRALDPMGSYGRHHAAIRTGVVRLLRGGGHAHTYIGGPLGSGRARLVEQIARDVERPVLRVDVPGLLTRSERTEDALVMLSRDARLHDAVLHLADVDVLADQGERRSPQTAVVRSWLRTETESRTVLTGTLAPGEISTALGIHLSGHELPFPDIDERAELWSALIQGPDADESRRLIHQLASKFRFTPGQMRRAVRDAASRSGADDVVGVEELHRSCREGSNQRLLLHARKLRPNYTWDDIVVPDDLRQQLEEICASVRQRRTVYGTWGFESKFSVGRGLNILFAGPSGVGKTMSAEIIAGDLAVDAYKIDLSCVVSKYVGETEQNLARIFDEAETSNSILFFDEADALFGKRSEVKDAHDRYANIEISYLLQELDEYPGIVILATNFKGNMDAAFTRRLTHVVDFPEPDVGLRLRLWEGMFPPDVPMGGDVDFDFLARQFALTGGHIKNVVLNACFMAAHESEDVLMAHLIRATKREYDKLGKLSSKSEFGPYMKLARAASES